MGIDTINMIDSSVYIRLFYVTSVDFEINSGRRAKECLFYKGLRGVFDGWND